MSKLNTLLQNETNHWRIDKSKKISMVWGFTGNPQMVFRMWSNIYFSRGTCLSSLWKMSSCAIIPVVINHHLECVWVCLGGGIFHSSTAKKTESRLVLLPSVSTSELWWFGSSQFESWRTKSQGRRLKGKIWMIQGLRSRKGPLEDYRDYSYLVFESPSCQRALNFHQLHDSLFSALIISPAHTTL